MLAYEKKNQLYIYIYTMIVYIYIYNSPSLKIILIQMVSSVFTEIIQLTHNLILEHFYHLKKKSRKHTNHFPIPSVPPLC